MDAVQCREEPGEDDESIEPVGEDLYSPSVAVAYDDTEAKLSNLLSAEGDGSLCWMPSVGDVELVRS